MAAGFFKSIMERFSSRPVDWDDLEELLIRADLGVPMTLQIIDRLQALPTEPTADTVVKVARDEIAKLLPRDNPPIRPFPAKPKVILIVGVNGVGKTTSVAKLAHHFHSNRHSVMLVAGDTFRAAAIEQLDVWAKRIGVEMIKGAYNADPASLCYDAYQSAMRKNIEYLICDTAGRLHTKHNLMQELDKVRRILGKCDASAPHESFLVIDATTGSNGVEQAKQFKEAAALTGIIATKLDGSGKGGSVVAIQRELDIPTRFIGTGEKLEDFSRFDPDAFVSGIL